MAFTGLFLPSFAQERIAPADIQKGDTIPVVTLNEVNIYPPYNFYENFGRRDARKLSRLARNIKKVYPYAKLAGILLEKYDSILLQANNDAERKKIMKRAEEELEQEFGDDLRALTFSQGAILLKLVDRETGESTFELVQQLRGKFRAFFYQAFARIFGFNLKVKYDPTGEDRNIEFIVRLIETGRI